MLYQLPSSRNHMPGRTARGLPLTLSLSRKGRGEAALLTRARVEMRPRPLSPRGRGTGMRGLLKLRRSQNRGAWH